MDEKPYSLRRWIMIGVPVLATIAITAAECVHMFYKVGWHLLFGALLIVLGIQTVCYISMFWIRRSYVTTRRISILGLVLSGACLLGVVLTLDYYLLHWKIVSTNRLGQDGVQIPIYTAVVVVLLSLWQRHYPATGTKDTSR